MSVACGFNRIKIHFSDYLENLISRINEVYCSFSIKYRYNDIYCKQPLGLLQSQLLLCCMVSVMSASGYVTSTSIYQNQSSMYS